MALRPRAGRWLLGAWAVGVLVFLMAPLVVIFPISFSSSAYLQFPPPGWSLRWYQAYLNDSTWIDATYRSVKVAP